MAEEKYCTTKVKTIFTLIIIVSFFCIFIRIYNFDDDPHPYKEVENQMNKMIKEMKHDPVYRVPSKFIKRNCTSV